jgi:hypothetical protein
MKTVGEAIEFSEYLNTIFDKYFRDHENVEVENRAMCLMEELKDLYIYENPKEYRKPTDELFSDIANTISDAFGLDAEAVYYTLESVDFTKGE